jgi:hypothetical protein
MEGRAARRALIIFVTQTENVLTCRCPRDCAMQQLAVWSPPILNKAPVSLAETFGGYLGLEYLFVFYFSHGVETEPTWYCGHCFAYCTSL